MTRKWMTRTGFPEIMNFRIILMIAFLALIGSPASAEGRDDLRGFRYPGRLHRETMTRTPGPAAAEALSPTGH